ncbi:MAG: hypothetical protein IT291_00450 [Deltaproteobacteria bacterium]|nr:hypothetical protein [Deltaproteobacteria bacterium]
MTNQTRKPKTKQQKKQAISAATSPGGRVPFHRISITIREDQYKTLIERELSLSALVRDLLDDRFSSNKVTINLSDQGKHFYDMLISNFGTQDIDLEPFLLQALDNFVGQKINQIQEIRKQLKNQL